MGITKTWDPKKKCWHLTQSHKTAKQLAGGFLTLLGPAGWVAKAIAKGIMKEKMKKKNYCPDDIKWAMKNI